MILTSQTILLEKPHLSREIGEKNATVSIWNYGATRYACDTAFWAMQAEVGMRC